MQNSSMYVYIYIYVQVLYPSIIIIINSVMFILIVLNLPYIYIFRTGPCLVQALGSQDLVAGDVVHRVVALTTNHQTIAIPRRVG